MTPTTQTVAARVDPSGIAVLDATTAPVSVEELHHAICRFHQNPQVRAVVMAHGLITALLSAPRPPQKGLHR